MLTRKAPFANMQPVQIIWLVGASGQRLPIPDDCPQLFHELLTATWKDNPAERCVRVCACQGRPAHGALM
jgi:hypothetical protein